MKRAWKNRNKPKEKEYRDRFYAKTAETRAVRRQYLADVAALRWALAQERKRIHQRTKDLASLKWAIRKERAKAKAREKSDKPAYVKARAKYALCPLTKAKHRERKHRRKALLLRATHDNSAPAKYKHLLSTATACHWCGCPIGSSTMEVDHYIPLSRGGGHVADNLVASCARCNRQRRDMLADEYALWLEHRRKQAERQVRCA